MQDGSSHWPQRIGILGVGLLGGSAALALRRARPDCEIRGLVRDRSGSERLLELGVVDFASTDLRDVCSECDVVMVATPVDRLAALVVEAASITGADCLITDVGSTKARIVEAVAKDPMADAKFVGAHPIAGSEKTGAEHASATLMDEKVIVLTPTPRTTLKRLQQAIDFWTLTGGTVQQMTAEAHDTHLASVSHVPHLVSALIARLPNTTARPLVGTGWQDITRVAAGDPGMWAAICQENRDAIRHELQRFASELDRLRKLIESEDDERLHAWLVEAKQLKQQSN